MLSVAPVKEKHGLVTELLGHFLKQQFNSRAEYLGGLSVPALHSALGHLQSLSGLWLFVSASVFLHSTGRKKQHLVKVKHYSKSFDIIPRTVCSYFTLKASSLWLTFKALSAASLASLAAASAALIASVMFL